MGKKLEHYVRLKNMASRAKLNLVSWEYCTSCTPQATASNKAVEEFLLQNGFMIDMYDWDNEYDIPIKGFVGDPENPTEIFNKVIEIEASHGIEWTIDTIEGAYC